MSQSGDPNFFSKFPTKCSRFVSHPKIRGRTEKKPRRKGNWIWGQLAWRRQEGGKKREKRIGDESVKNAPKIEIKTVYFMY